MLIILIILYWNMSYFVNIAYHVGWDPLLLW
jgi:hypothetical protein